MEARRQARECLSGGFKRTGRVPLSPSHSLFFSLSETRACRNNEIRGSSLAREGASEHHIASTIPPPTPPLSNPQYERENASYDTCIPTCPFGTPFSDMYDLPQQPVALSLGFVYATQFTLFPLMTCVHATVTCPL